jgi:hypothetical protein
MKKQITLVLTLVVSLMTACDNTDPVPNNNMKPVPSPEAIIRSVYPSAGAPGSTVAIFGENFGPTISQNYVTFDSVSADVTYAGYGILNVIVPENLADGSYTINLNTDGRMTSAPSIFTVTNSPY